MRQDQSKNVSGRRIGHYTVLEQIGSGGMGEVFSAVRSDGHFDQKVALKLVRAAAASGIALDHFRNERQILAGLDHPNIAHLYDGGTTEDGTPYFAMELVAGLPIDEYCDARKLSVSRRLELFREVCSAVQYAHQHLVVHRDIKPGNILVTEDGTPKLLDFGIARIFDASGIVAATQYRSFTPDYASPEQLRGEPLSTATDLYSLGVVLYRLLTGRSPYRVDTRSPGKLATAITKDEPERPSARVTQSETVSTANGLCELTPEFFSEAREATPPALQRSLRGDLDYILLKALRKEPERRYASSEQFSEDLRCHLAGLTVSARKGTWNYRAGKFLHRHRAGAVATALVLAALATGVGITLREARIAEANRRKADARFNDVRKLANSLLFEVHDSIQTLPGATDSRKLILQKAVEYLDSLAADTQNDPALMRDLVAGYSRIAELEGNPYFPNLGDTKASLATYKKSIDLEQALIRSDPKNDTYQFNLARLYMSLAEVHMGATGNVPEAFEYGQKALAIFDRLVISRPNDRSVIAQASNGYANLALMQVGNGLTGTTGTVQGGVEALEKALVYGRRAIELAPTDVNLRAHEGNINIALGDAQLKLGNRPKAEECFRNGFKILNAADPKGENIRIAHNKAVVTTKIGDALMIEGKYAEALEHYRDGLGQVEKLKNRDPHNEAAQDILLVARGQVGLALTQLGRYSEANQSFHSALSGSAGVAPTSSARAGEAVIGIWFGQALEHQKKFPEAAREYERSQSALTALGAGASLDSRTRAYFCSAASLHAGMMAAQGRFADAQKEFETSVATLEALVAASPTQQELKYALANSYTGEAVLFEELAKTKRNSGAQLADLKKAGILYRTSLATWSKVSNPAKLSTIGLEVVTPAEVGQMLAACNSRMKHLETPEAPAN